MASEILPLTIILSGFLLIKIATDCDVDKRIVPLFVFVALLTVPASMGCWVLITEDSGDVELTAIAGRVMNAGFIVIIVLFFWWIINTYLVGHLKELLRNG